MLYYPHLDPVALHLGPIRIHWYGLMYLLGFLGAGFLARHRAPRTTPPWTLDEVSNCLFLGALGVILGGRVGYMLFYQFPLFMNDPLSLFKIWQGGMSFHGGLLGVLCSFWIFAKKYHKTFFQVSDFIAPLVPIGLGAGRIGNFINGELWGRATDVPWGIIFPQAGLSPRHPSQLYECLLEGIFLFLTLWFFSAKNRPRMAVSALFLIGYACARMLAEFFRQPDPQLGYLAFNWLTMGQLLSLPMLVFGLILLFQAYRAK